MKKKKTGDTFCRDCGLPIKFVKTPKGKFMPVDPVPFYFEADRQGDALLVDHRGNVVRGFIVKPHDSYDPYKIGYRPHWAICGEDKKKKLEQRQALERKHAREAEQKAEADRRAEQAAMPVQQSLF